MSKSRWLSPVAAVALVLLVAAIYASTIGAGFVVWDDDDHVYENPHIRAAGGYAEGWRDWRNPSFYPITFTTFYWEWRLADGQPWLFHLDNVVLHAANAVLAGLLGGALGLPAGVAWAAAGVWALHPVQVASVAWITERKNVLFVFFYLASMLTYARALDTGRSRWWALSIVLAVASLTSKATAVTLPLAIVLLHWARGERADGRAVVRILPYFAAATLVGFLHVAREQLTPTLGLATRLLVAARAIWFYVGKFLWPSELVAMYPRWPAGETVVRGLPAAIALAAVLAIAVWQRRRLSRAAWFAAGFFLLNIVLVVGVVWFPYLRYSFVADHLAYTANLGLALGAALAGAAVLRRLAVPATVGAALVVALWVGLAAVSRDQVAAWRDTEQLWKRTLAVNPSSTLAHNNLGIALTREGRSEEARAHFEAALREDPTDAQALLNLGVMAAARGDWAEAIGRYKRQLRRRPRHPYLWNNLGGVAAARGQDARAEWFYRRAVSLDPTDAETHLHLGSTLVRRGDLDGGIRELGRAIDLDSRLAAARIELAGALAKAGQTDAAIARYEEALSIDPDNTSVRTDLTDLLIERGDLSRAAEVLRAGVERTPQLAWFHVQLAQVLGELGDVEGALRQYDAAIPLASADDEKAELHALVAAFLEEVGRPGAAERYAKALALDPDQVDAHYGLAALLAADGRPAEAVAHYREVLRIDPDHAQATSALGALLVTQGRRREGIALLERAITLEPDDEDLREALATALHGERPAR